MFFISTDNKLYYRGQNYYGRAGLGHTSGVSTPEEVIITDSNGEIIDVNSIVDFAEYYRSSAILLNSGEVYVTSGSSNIFQKLNIENIVQICASAKKLYLLNKDGVVYTHISQATTCEVLNSCYVAGVSKPMKKVKKIGSINQAVSTYAYGLAYYITEDNELYVWGIDIISTPLDRFSKLFDDIECFSGYATNYGSSTVYFYAKTKSNQVYCYGNRNGLNVEIQSFLPNITKSPLFKTSNTNKLLAEVDIVDILYINGINIIIIYKEDGVLKYAFMNYSSSCISGESFTTNNNFYEVIPNENNFNFERFSPEIMVDTCNQLMYMWEKETGDLYMAGHDYATGSGVNTTLTKVELPTGTKVKRPKKSSLYHNYTDITIPTNAPVLTVSMFPEGAFNQDLSGFKVWDGEKYDRALFVEELEDLYKIDTTKCRQPIYVNTTDGEKLLATVNMIEYPLNIKDEGDLAIVGKAIVGKSILKEV